jgi:hypothetical protein
LPAAEIEEQVGTVVTNLRELGVLDAARPSAAHSSGAKGENPDGDPDDRRRVRMQVPRNA